MLPGKDWLIAMPGLMEGDDDVFRNVGMKSARKVLDLLTWEVGMKYDGIGKRMMGVALYYSEVPLGKRRMEMCLGIRKGCEMRSVPRLEAR